MAKEKTTDEYAAALRVFIISGSADGREEMRKICRDKVQVLAAGPRLLKVSKAFLALDQDFRQHDKGAKPGSYKAWLNENTEARRVLIDAIAEAERKAR